MPYSDKNKLSDKIRIKAQELGFESCGFCKAETVNDETLQAFRSWIGNHYHADMLYMENYEEKRFDPSLLVEGAKSIVSVALNYYPSRKLPTAHPQFAYYAYGKDYHEVLKEKLNLLLDYIQQECPQVTGRAFVDTAPILERYWAQQAGLGFIGRNSCLILPQKGSYFFLGELILTAELAYNTSTIPSKCGNCTRCIDHCPTHAIVKPSVIDSNKCISYQTIENKKEIDPTVGLQLANNVYGCDICQHVCPWNRFAQPHQINQLLPSEELMNLSAENLDKLSIETYQKIFKGSAVKRAKYSGLMRNWQQIKKNSSPEK